MKIIENSFENLNPIVMNLLNKHLVFEITREKNGTVRMDCFDFSTGMRLEYLINAIKSQDPSRYDSSNWDSKNHTGFLIIDGVNVNCISYTLLDSMELTAATKMYIEQVGEIEGDTIITFKNKFDFRKIPAWIKRVITSSEG